MIFLLNTILSIYELPAYELFKILIRLTNNFNTEAHLNGFFSSEKQNANNCRSVEAFTFPTTFYYCLPLHSFFNRN